MANVDAILNQAWQAHQSGQVQAAEKVYRQITQQLPQHANAWCFLGIALHDLHRYQEAIEAYNKALQIHPDFPIALNNLGNTLRYAFRPEDAEACFRRAIQLKPDYFNAHKNRGTLHVWNGNLDLALECYRQAMQLAPNDPELHRNLGVIHLLKGEFEIGWREYRWRWLCPEMPRPKYMAPVWQGEPLQGKTILLYAEQGLGDTFHFIRFAKQLHEEGARVLVHGPASLTGFLGKVPWIDAWIPQSIQVTSAFDYHCSIVDVADIRGLKTETIPPACPYLTAPPYLIDYWRDWFRQFPSKGRRIGLAWQGNRDHQADAFRSFPLSTYHPLGELPDVQLFSLQFGFGKEQLAGWRGRNPIHTLPEDIDQSSGAFMDTSAVLQHLDLVITSDTSIAHLAGALNREVWVLLSLVPDWRWLLGGEQSAWYPSMRLFRQTQQGDWNSVVQQVVERLQEPLR